MDRKIGVPPDVSSTMGYFYGVATFGRGGAGIILYISKTHFFHSKFGCGRSTNTIEELLALWGLLFLASTMGLPKLMLFGDSRIIIDWINNMANLQVLELEDWCKQTKTLKDTFQGFICQHIYREHNQIVD